MKAYIFTLSHNDMDGYLAADIAASAIVDELYAKYQDELELEFVQHHCDYSNIGFNIFAEQSLPYASCDEQYLAITDLNFKDQNFSDLVEFLQDLCIKKIIFIDHHQNSKETIEKWREKIKSLVSEYVEIIDDSRCAAYHAHELRKSVLQNIIDEHDVCTPAYEHAIQLSIRCSQFQCAVDVVDASDRYDQSIPTYFTMGRVVNEQFKRIQRNLGNENLLVSQEAKLYRHFLISRCLNDLLEVVLHTPAEGRDMIRKFVAFLEYGWLDNETGLFFDKYRPVGIEQDSLFTPHPRVLFEDLEKYYFGYNGRLEKTVDEIMELYWALILLYDEQCAYGSIYENWNVSSSSILETIDLDENKTFVFIYKPQSTSLLNTIVRVLNVADAGAIFYPRSRVELRNGDTYPELDLSKVGAKLGGGGHRGAAGFPLPKDERNDSFMFSKLAHQIIDAVEEQI